jgi:tetratricopeptide (TPR) repeat protein
LARERDRAVAINEFLLESLRSASAYEAGRELTTAELLTLTADRIEDWFADEPWLQVRLRSLIGHTYFDLGRYAEADQMLSEAVANRERAYGAAHLGAKTGLFDPEILWSILPGGSTWYDQRRERLWLSPVNSRWGDIDVVTLAHARARTGDIAGAKRAIREQKSFTTGPLYSLMAELARAKGDLDESVRLYRLELAQGIASMEEWHRAATLSRLGSLYLELGLAAEAEEALREVVALEEAILPTPEHARLLAHRNNVAVALFAQGRRTEALELLLPEVEMARALLTHRHPDFATVHRNLSAMNATPDGAASEPFCGSLFHQGEGGPEGLALRVSAMK